MNQIVPLQVIVLLIISVVCALFSGLPGFLSALAGGFSYILPTLVAVLLLKFSRRNPNLQSSMFIGGEVLKVVLSLVSMLVVFAIWPRSLVFYPFLLAFLSVSHLVFLVLLRVKHYGR